MTGAISHSGLRTPDWLAIKLQSNEAAGASLTAILRGLDGVEKQLFALRGMAMLQVEERQLYRWVMDEEVGDYYQSFDRWMKQELPNSWGYCRDALRTIKELRDTPFEDLLQIKRCNLEQLKKVSSNVRLLPEVVQAAKHLPEKAFVEKLNNSFDQHLDVKAPVLMAPAEVVKTFEEAVDRVIAYYQCTRSEALEYIGRDILEMYAVAAPVEQMVEQPA
jgi:hypothetical protein